MTSGILHDQNLEKHIEKQMGCMAGFFQRFDRHQILAGRRLHATKRLPPPVADDSTPEITRELEKPQLMRAMTSPSPDRLKSSPVTDIRSSGEIPAALPLPLPIFESKGGTRSSRKFSKEAPRLSLDSRAIVDAKGKIRINPAVPSSNRGNDSGDVVAAAADGNDKRRSPSVIAKLMGLEMLPNSSPAPTNNPELRRSASESRVSRDLYHYPFIEGNNFQLNQQNQFHSVIRENAVRENTTAATLNGRPADPMNSEHPKPLYKGVSASTRKSHQLRKSFFDSADFFPEPKQTVSVYGEIEKRLKMRGIDEPSKDLDTLKHILEALQLKGLLHSNKASEQISHRNFVYEQSFSSDASPIVLIKPSRSPVSYPAFGNDSPPASSRNRPGVRRNLNNSGENLLSMSPRRERQSIEPRSRNPRSPTRRESNVKSPNSSPARRSALSVETHRKTNESSEQRRASPVLSPRPSPKRNGSDQTITARLPRNTKSTAEIKPKEKISSFLREDESSSVSETSVSSSSQTDTERLKMEECKGGGRSLLERCDKLLHSILEMTATELQPSPVSVLDSSFYKDESSSPSPVLKRGIVDFKDDLREFEEEMWSPAISPLRSRQEDELDDCDFVYISDVLRASNYLPEDSDVFLLLEKQQFLLGKDTSKVSRLQRKLIFDTITEILNRNGQLPPWKVISQPTPVTKSPSLHQIWSEFQRLRERDTAEDLFKIICGVLRKDLAGEGINGWGDCPIEMSESVLDIERLIFKDLVSETIRDLTGFAGNNRAPFAPPCRKLVF